MNPFVDIEEMPIVPEEASGTSQSNVGGISIGSGSKSFRADSSGIWMGADTWAEAPFRVDMSGNMVASSAILTGSGYTKTVTFAQASIPTSVAVGDLWVDTDDKNKLYRAAMVGANEIRAGEWVKVDQDTYKLDKVGGSYTTTALTAAKVEIFPTTNIGIRAYASNGTSVVFQVNVGGTNVGDVLIGDYNNPTDGRGMLWDNSARTLYIKGNIVAGTVYANTLVGDIDEDRIIANVLVALKEKLSDNSTPFLSGIYSNLGNITAGTITGNTIIGGTITGTTITGGVLRTSASGRRVELNTDYDEIYMYGSGGLYGRIFEDGGALAIEGGSSGSRCLIEFYNNTLYLYKNLEAYGWGSFGGDVDLTTHKLTNCNGINWKTNSNQDGDGKMWFYTSSGNYYLRMDMGSRQQFDTHGV